MTRTPVDAHLTAEILTLVRRRGPLIHCLTNAVTPALVANVLLAIGASPAMVDIPEESRDFAAVAGGVLVNLGSASREQRAAIQEAVSGAVEASTPWVLDPVGVGALPVRTDLARRIIEQRPTAIRGNASEIMALAGHGEGGKGPDSTHSVAAAAQAATELAHSTGAVVAISGPMDLITDGVQVARVDHGHELFTRVTGAGCALGAVATACVAVADDPFVAVLAAHTIYGLAGDIAASQASGPGSFAVALLDALHAMDPATVTAEARIQR